LLPGADVQAEIEALPDDGGLAEIYLYPGTYRGGFSVTRPNTHVFGCTKESGSPDTEVICAGPRASEGVDAAVVKRDPSHVYQWGEPIVGLTASDVWISRLTVDSDGSTATDDQGSTAIGFGACYEPDETCEHHDRLDGIVIQDNVFVDSSYIDIGVNNAGAVIRNNDLTGENFIGIWVSGSDASEGGQVRIEGNTIADKADGGGWGVAATAPTWGQGNCDESGDCVYGAGKLHVMLSDNTITNVRWPITMVLQTASGESNGVGPHAMTVVARHNHLEANESPVSLFDHQGWKGDGYTIDVLLADNESTVAGTPGGSLDLVAYDDTYPSHTALHIEDPDEILPAALLDSAGCGPAGNGNEVKVFDATEEVRGACP